jgi:hypothetical protein
MSGPQPPHRRPPAALLSLPWLLGTLASAGELGAGQSLAGWLPGELSGLFASAGVIALTYLATRAGLRLATGIIARTVWSVA